MLGMCLRKRAHSIADGFPGDYALLLLLPINALTFLRCIGLTNGFGAGFCARFKFCAAF